MGSQGHCTRHCTHTSYLHTVCIHIHTHTLQHTTSNHRLSFSCPFPHTTAYCSLLHTQIMTSPKGTPNPTNPHTHMLLKLLPAVGPSPVVSLVQTIPHSHHLIATVIEDGSESSREQTENCTATEHTDTYDPHSQTGNLVSQDTCKGHTLHDAMTDTSQHISTVGLVYLGTAVRMWTSGTLQWPGFSESGGVHSIASLQYL